MELTVIHTTYPYTGIQIMEAIAIAHKHSCTISGLLCTLGQLNTCIESGVYKIHFSGATSAASVRPQGAVMNNSACLWYNYLNLENEITSTEKRNGIGIVYECNRASVTTLLCLPSLGHAAFQVVCI